ncbi:MAG: PadR family transcriptional regulator [Glycomyces artemisiae]|uniref:PadR family transcriptional regulator n=1 Tax=Glycomyces artemisiae TaxID=1076443 RepID=A0A2T0UVZ5_9ACTN|nr:PadR family transcriptional regulator [Glycomyces artemisiae]PRY62017.1 PadR family transcriptional regulator [Glycomyces artemisiae]
MHGTVVCVDRSQLLKGLLDIIVLRVLADEDAYGYEILHRLRKAGFEELGDATVYGTLRRLFKAGHLSTYVMPSDAGPHRKYYALTATGRTRLRAMREAWEDVSGKMRALLDSPEKG